MHQQHHWMLIFYKDDYRDTTLKLISDSLEYEILKEHYRELVKKYFREGVHKKSIKRVRRGEISGSKEYRFFTTKEQMLCTLKSVCAILFLGVK